jgi:hypothetical protein
MIHYVFTVMQSALFRHSYTKRILEHKLQELTLGTIHADAD